MSTHLLVGNPTAQSGRNAQRIQTAIDLLRLRGIACELFSTLPSGRTIPALLEREHPKFVVVSLGANDGTTLRDGDTAIDFGDPKWRQVYAARVDTVMRTLAGEDTHVLWLLLPPMRDARLNARGAVLNTLFTQRAKRAPRVEVLELDVLLSNDDRQYATFVQTDDGRLVRYRLDDGVHLAPAGSRAVARWVQDWVRERHRTKPTRPRPK